MKKDHYKHAGPEMPPLHEGEKVMVQDPKTKTWKPAEVAATLGKPRLYDLTTTDVLTLIKLDKHQCWINMFTNQIIILKVQEQTNPTRSFHT